MMELITIATGIINIVIGWYILFTIPKQLKSIRRNTIIIDKKIDILKNKS
jgi:hypothetical protein